MTEKIEQNSLQLEKKAYSSPVVEEYGSIRAMTQSAGVKGASDGGGGKGKTNTQI